MNKNGVSITEKEKKFIDEFYGEQFFENMTIEDYEWISDLNINTSTDITIKSTYSPMINAVNENNIKKSPQHQTKSKKISVAKSCNTICIIVTNVQWFINPNIRSYDLIGFRFQNTESINSIIDTKVSSTKGTEYFSNNRIFSNGLGTSVKLPEGATNISIQQKITTKKGGRVYASYQHATSNISLSTSMKYQIGSSGLGGVFIPYDDAIGKFDKMQGVEIDL